MKKAVTIGAAFVASSFMLGCNSSTFRASELAIQPALPLVSPQGVRIAKSLDELTQPPFLESRHGSTKPVTITKITYGREADAPPIDEYLRSKGAAVTNATIHYKTSSNETGVYFIEIVNSK